MPPSAIARAPYLPASVGESLSSRTERRAKRLIPIGLLALLAVATFLSAGAQPRTVAVTAAAVFGLAFWIGRASGHARAVLQAVAAAGAANALLVFALGNGDAEWLGWPGGDATALGLGLVAALALLLEKLHRSMEPGVGVGRATASLCETLVARAWPALVGLSLIAAALLALPGRTGPIAAAVGGVALLAASLLAPSLELAGPRARRFLIGGLAVLLLGLGGIGALESALHTHQIMSIGGSQADAGSGIAELASGLGISGAVALAAALLVLGVICAVGVRRRRRDAVYPCAGVAAAALIAAQAWFGASLHGGSAVFFLAMLLGVGTAQAFGSGRKVPRA